jgi:hypothetical protein
MRSQLRRERTTERKMAYVKSVMVGVVGAVIAAVLWVLVAFVLPVFTPLLVSRVTGSPGGAGAAIGSGSILAAAVIGFVGGFYWMFRRS